MENLDLEQSSRANFKVKYGVIVAILIGAWIIGMSILAAGWIVTKEIAKENAPYPDYNSSQLAGPVNIEVPEGLPVLGDNNAKVTLVEFADFQCPYCGEWQKTVFQQIKSKYIDTGKVRFVFMDFPFLGAESTRAAEAGRCAADQGKFWEYHDLLFSKQKGENEGVFADVNLKQFANDLHLNELEFNSCLDLKKYEVKLAEDMVKADGYGVQSTPTLFINGNKLEGLLTFAEYEQVIEAELSK